MQFSADVAPSNSVILVMDRSAGVIPDGMSGGLVAATSSCVAVGTLSEWDGETHITLGDEGPANSANRHVFDGVLETPNAVISVCTVPDDEILAIRVDHKTTRVRIWVNDEAEPNEIHIMVSPP